MTTSCNIVKYIIIETLISLKWISLNWNLQVLSIRLNRTGYRFKCFTNIIVKCETNESLLMNYKYDFWKGGGSKANLIKFPGNKIESAPRNPNMAKQRVSSLIIEPNPSFSVTRTWDLNLVNHYLASSCSFRRVSLDDNTISVVRTKNDLIIWRFL